MSEKKPFIGNSIVAVNERMQILMGERIYHPLGITTPGGKVDYCESIIDSCRRETLEEAGFEIENIEQGPVGENIYPEKDLHSITIFLFGTVKGEIKNMEPEKMKEWKWYSLEELAKKKPSDFAFNYEPVFKDDFKLIREYHKKIFGG